MTTHMTAAALQEFYRNEGNTRAKREDREGPVHKAILQFLRLSLPRNAVVHHSPNEVDMQGRDAAWIVAKARGLGTVKGWPDLEIILDGRVYFIEVKAENGRQEDAQKAVQEGLALAGAPYAVCRSVDDAEAALKTWGLL